jgi:hypothetical protein
MYIPCGERHGGKLLWLVVVGSGVVVVKGGVLVDSLMTCSVAV